MIDIDEAMVISFLGIRTDRHGFGILTWKYVGTQKISTQISIYITDKFYESQIFSSLQRLTCAGK